MKKLVFMFVAAAALTIAACGGKNEVKDAAKEAVETIDSAATVAKDSLAAATDSAAAKVDSAATAAKDSVAAKVEEVKK